MRSRRTAGDTRHARPLLTRRRVLLVVIASVVLLGLATRFYVFPREDAVPQHADAVLVLGPATQARTDLGRSLVASGVADTLVVSVLWHDYLASVGERDVAICDDTSTSLRVICFVADPETTSGEGQALAQLAARNGWTDVIVITQTPHLERARSILARCWEGRTWMRSSGEPRDAGRWIFEYAYQTLGYAKMLMTGRCADTTWVPIVAPPAGD